MQVMCKIELLFKKIVHLFTGWLFETGSGFIEKVLKINRCYPIYQTERF